MKTLNISDIKGIMNITADTVLENEKHFCDLDAVTGDGDFGMTLAKGFKVIKVELGNFDSEDIGGLMKAIGMSMLETCGGATGSLWGAGFRAMGKDAKGKSEVSLVDISEMVKAFIQGMQKVGGAVVGDKTLLDALIPAAEAMAEDSKSEDVDIAAAFKHAGEAAAVGAEKTKDMIAKKGRATYLGKRSLGNPDAGAEAISILLRK
ncbi:MAG: dihydroxyacetone kinase subunit DhaL [Candidatus Theseobacter exili]|nr:dihydroxyacetone kinase subunit DhaL [Candidatus Theseobacter exili]